MNYELAVNFYTLIGLLMFGCFHRLHNTDDTDNIVKKASTKLEYVISISTSLVKSMSRDKMFWKNYRLLCKSSYYTQYKLLHLSYQKY